VLAAPHRELGCLIVPDAEGPGRREALRVAAGDRPAAVGPDGPPEALPASWRLAVAALQVAGRGGLVVADDHLAATLLHTGADAVARIARRRLAPLGELTPAARERMARTALAYVQHQGNAAAMARALHVHPQTARYRIARLRELLGGQLDDPAARFELEAALRYDGTASVSTEPSGAL
jgi:sugar diacid utilization regulator